MGFWSDTFGGGNSFSESVANVTTGDDNYEYRGGTLYDNTTNNPVSKDQFGSDSKYGPLGSADSKSTDAYSYNLNQGNAPTQSDGTAAPMGSNATSARGGISNGLGAIMRSPVAMGGLGLMSGGIGPALMTGAIAAGRGRKYDQKNPAFPINRDLTADPEFKKKTAAQKVNFGRLGTEGTTYTSDELKQIREGKGRIEGAFFKDGDTSKQFKMNMFGNSYEVDTDGQNAGNSTLIREQAEAAMLPDDGGGVAGLRYAPRTQATVPTSTMPAMSDMSREAAAGANMPIPNSNYDPNDPTSMKYIINPTYDQIVAYKRGLPGYTPVEPDSNMSAEMIQAIKNGTLGKVFGYAEGGEVESALGGNEKDLINDAEKAIRGELDETRASIVLAQYVQQYGEDALRDLVDSVRSGEADETRERFARGENGMVRGNGDGSGTDDKVTAQLKDGDATQDVLLADGEFVLRKDATEAIEKMYGGGVLDKVNDAGPNAAKELSRYMTG